MADKYLRRLGDLPLPKEVKVTPGDQTGDRQRWQRSWEIAGPQLTQASLAASVDKLLAASWTKTGSSQDRSGQRSSWSFRGDDGRSWKALSTIGPTSSGGASQFLVTVSVEQTPAQG